VERIGICRQQHLFAVVVSGIVGSVIVTVSFPLAGSEPDSENTFPAQSWSLHPARSTTASAVLRITTCSFPRPAIGFGSIAATWTPLGTIERETAAPRAAASPLATPRRRGVSVRPQATLGLPCFRLQAASCSSFEYFETTRSSPARQFLVQIPAVRRMTFASVRPYLPCRGWIVTVLHASLLVASFAARPNAWPLPAVDAFEADGEFLSVVQHAEESPSMVRRTLAVNSGALAAVEISSRAAAATNVITTRCTPVREPPTDADTLRPRRRTDHLVASRVVNANRHSRRLATPTLAETDSIAPDSVPSRNPRVLAYTAHRTPLITSPKSSDGLFATETISQIYESRRFQ